MNQRLPCAAGCPGPWRISPRQSIPFSCRPLIIKPLIKLCAWGAKECPWRDEQIEQVTMPKEPVVGIQIAALPLRRDKKGRLEVLMVTSRDSGRWVMPKGWVMNGKKPWAAAEIEALEEAGAEGRISKDAIGFYHYDKILDNGEAMPCRVTVYPMLVEKLKRKWKERHQRKRHWFTPENAARRVAEPELAKLLTKLDDKKTGLKAILKAS